MASRIPRTEMRMVSGTPPSMNGSHSSMNGTLNWKAANTIPSTMKMPTHTAASLTRNGMRAERASRVSLILENVEMSASEN
jgi:hypothetical protein